MSAERKSFALQILSGKQQGGLHPLAEGSEIVIGRSPGVDLLLAEDMISRRHAKIVVEAGGETFIEDLGSTNGTFVNGERIEKIAINTGDRILVGATILTMVDQGDEMLLLSSPPEFTVSGAMSGRLEEVALPGVLQLFGASHKSGTLYLQDREKTAKVHLRNGRVIYASLGNAGLPPEKAIQRILTWERGAFELRPQEEQEFPSEIQETTEALLMESMRQIDEIRTLSLPEDGVFTLVPNPPPLRDLEPKELDLLQVALIHRTFDRILDHGEGSDLEVATTLKALVEKGYLKCDEDAE